MVEPRATVLLLVGLMGLALSPRDAAGVIIYRIGTPFSVAEEDSLQDLGIDIAQIDWSFAERLEGFELDSLAVGSLQPNYFEEDENIALTALSRDGWITVYMFYQENALFAQVLLDGDPTTGYEWEELAPGSTRRSRITLNLGGQFVVKKVKVRPKEENPGRFLEGFTVGVTTEPVGMFRNPSLPPLPYANLQKPGAVEAPARQIRENTDPEVTVLVEPPHGIETRYMQLTINRETPKAVELVEFEVFGGGFVNQASYISDIIELESIASWGALTWSGRADPQARIDIRTRAGADRHPEVYWETRPEQQDSVRYLQGGGNLSAGDYKASYDRLPDVFKPADEQNQVSPDTENWSFWCSPYEFEQPGVGIVSPSSRRFIQLRADFSSTTEDGGKIDYVEFKASVPPAVREVVGEIFPVEAEVGEVTHFTYYIKPTIRLGDLGFDSVEIVTPSGFASVDSLRVEGVLQDGFSWQPKEDGAGFEIALPRKMGTIDSGAVLEVVFNAPVLREVGTSFDGKVFDSTHPHEVRQRIDAGNAADEVESDLLSVKTSLSKSLLFSPRAAPTPFTPNGDTINDELLISYTLLRITAPVPVSVNIYDLCGNLVKQVYSGDDLVGAHVRSWDGTNRSGRLVPPGIYLYRIGVDAQTKEEVGRGIISVVY